MVGFVLDDIIGVEPMKYTCDECGAEVYDDELEQAWGYDDPRAGCCPDCGSTELTEHTSLYWKLRDEE